MKLPVMFNSNFEIQDREGNLVADLWKNANRNMDGPILVRALNAGLGGKIVPAENIAVDVGPISVNGDVVNYPIKKMTTSERMKEYWRKRREAKASV